ncbi:MAG: thioredoxin [Lachnospiraceae bacterium]|nr:thioredoxin [Lachnospiraceae bacterium]
MVNVIKNNDLTAAKASKFAVIDFSATWCNPCRMLAPVLEQVSEELAGEVDFFNCDVDANNASAIEFHISSIPAIVVLKDGQKIDMTVGFQPKESLKQFILSHK